MPKHDAPTRATGPDLLNFPVIQRGFADAMRANRRARDIVQNVADWNPDAMPHRAFVEQKHDGIRTAYLPGEIIGTTREGSRMLCTQHIAEMVDQYRRAIASVASGMGVHSTGWMLDGEYVNPESFEATLGDFKRGEGVGVFVLFDAVPLEAYEGRAISPSLYLRKAIIARAAAALPDNWLVRPVKAALFQGEARDNIELAAGAVWETGGEGVVVKDADSPYLRGDSPSWMRIKRRLTLDAKIVATEINAQGLLKSVVIALPKGGTCKVGVGFSEAQRRDLSLYTAGRVIEVSHLGFTLKGSLRSPSFSRFRDDRKEGNR